MTTVECNALSKTHITPTNTWLLSSEERVQSAFILRSNESAGVTGIYQLWLLQLLLQQ